MSEIHLSHGNHHHALQREREVETWHRDRALERHARSTRASNVTTGRIFRVLAVAGPVAAAVAAGAVLI